MQDKNENYCLTTWMDYEVVCTCDGGRIWFGGNEWDETIKKCPSCGQVYYIKIKLTVRVATWFDKFRMKLLGRLDE